jgi:hypothetical protein
MTLAVPVRQARVDVAAARSDFPILRETAHGKPLVYLDNAATTQKTAGRHRSDRALLPPRERECAPRRCIC